MKIVNNIVNIDSEEQWPKDQPLRHTCSYTENGRLDLLPAHTEFCLKDSQWSNQ